jgi:hypothetical protein
MGHKRHNSWAWRRVRCQKRATGQSSSDVLGSGVLGEFRKSKTKKNTFFKKQSGEVVENKGKSYITSQKQTEKQSGEVVENTWLWKKQTGNRP